MTEYDEFEGRSITEAERKLMERGSKLTKVSLKTNLIVYAKKILSPLYNRRGD